LVKIYLYGHDVSKDTIEAAEWFRKAAEQGDAIAQNKLGTLYEEVKEVE